MSDHAAGASAGPAGQPPHSVASARLPRGLAAVLLGVTLAALVDAGAAAVTASRWQAPPVALAFVAVAVVSLVAGFEVAFLLARRAARNQQLELAALAHDLRAPLSTTRTLLDLIEGAAFGDLPQDARDAASRAANSTARAQALLEGALRQHATTAAATPPPPSVTLDEVLDRVEVSLAGQLAATGARVDRSPLPAVRSDAHALERVLTNLLQNALAHPRPGTRPHIEVSAHLEGASCEIAVRDHGTGVPADQRERVFEPGVRGFSPGGPAGFGLGLATVRRLIEQQGGRAWIDPAIEDGTCVRLTLPAA